MANARLPQFTLKTLFAATSVCALFCGYLRWTGHDALALGVAIALHIVFVPVPLAFVASVAIDGWQPTLARWNLEDGARFVGHGRVMDRRPASDLPVRVADDIQFGRRVATGAND